MSELDTAVEEIFANLRRLGRWVAARRGGALSSNLIKEQLTALGLNPPEDLVHLYTLGNGTRSNSGDKLDDIWLFPGYYWLSLEDARLTYATFRDDPRWNPGWFPIFASGGGDFYAVICDGTDSGVVGCLLGEEDQLVEYSSVTAMFSVLAKCFTEGAFFEGPAGYTADYPKMRLIAKKLYPDFAEHAV